MSLSAYARSRKDTPELIDLVARQVRYFWCYFVVILSLLLLIVMFVGLVARQVRVVCKQVHACGRVLLYRWATICGSCLCWSTTVAT